MGLLFFFALRAGAQDNSYRVVTFSSLSDSRWSPLAQMAFDAEGARWRHAESGRVMVHAASRAELARIIEEAHDAWSAAGAQLALPATTNRVRLICVYEQSTWDRLVKKGGVRPDGLALQSGRDILLKTETNQPLRADRVAHEMVHYRLREAYGSALPLWLEEGLATRMGISIARDFSGRKGVRLAGEWPAIPASDILPLAQLLGDAGYPESSGHAQAFGRQAAEFVGALAERVGSTGWSSLVNEIGSGADWRSVLSSSYGIGVTELQQIGDGAASRAMLFWSF